jgi:hypothetical protein
MKLLIATFLSLLSVSSQSQLYAGGKHGSSSTNAKQIVYTDLFDGGTLDASWNQFNPERLGSVDPLLVQGGQLKIHVTSAIPWFNSQSGFLLWKEITGPFDINTKVRVRQFADQTQQPTSGVRFSGLMIRNPAGNGSTTENYKFIVVGRQSARDNQVESKTTNNGSSSFTQWDTPDASQNSELRMTRDETGLVRIFSRQIGAGSWTERAFPTGNEAELGNVNADPVQIGICAYAVGGSPDFVAIVDEFVLAGEDSPLPVELVSFHAFVENNHVKLNWLTSTETNNFGFDIERHTGSNPFHKIGFVPGQGTTTQPHRYKFVDAEVRRNTSYTYRLKQVDTDGQFEYSPEIEAAVNSPRRFILRQNYPNPFNAETIINYEIPHEADVKLQVFDIRGRSIRTLKAGAHSSGSFTVTWDGKDEAGNAAASGIYFYRLLMDGVIKIKKLTLLK